jgi:hypothetical protein
MIKTASYILIKYSSPLSPIFRVKEQIIGRMGSIFDAGVQMMGDIVSSIPHTYFVLFHYLF